MSLVSCGRPPCTGKWASSPSGVLKALKGKQDTCEDCPNKKALEVVSLQYKSHHPQWWVVDGKVVIPIWVQERLRSEFHQMAD